MTLERVAQVNDAVITEKNNRDERPNDIIAEFTDCRLPDHRAKGESGQKLRRPEPQKGNDHH